MALNRQLSFHIGYFITQDQSVISVGIPWILITGFWNDSNVWLDEQVWDDGV